MKRFFYFTAVLCCVLFYTLTCFAPYPGVPQIVFQNFGSCVVTGRWYNPCRNGAFTLGPGQKLDMGENSYLGCGCVYTGSNYLTSTGGVLIASYYNSQTYCSFPGSDQRPNVVIPFDRCGPCTNFMKLTWDLRNNSSRSKMFLVFKDGIPVNVDYADGVNRDVGADPSGKVILSPRGNAGGMDQQRYTYSLPPCEGTNGYTLQEVVCNDPANGYVDFPGTPACWQTVPGTTQTNWECYACYTAITNTGSPSTVGTGTNITWNPTFDPSGANSNILWSAGTSSNINQALKEGFGANQGALNDVRAAIQSGTAILGSKLDALAASGGGGGGSNYVNVDFPTNLATHTDVVNLEATVSNQWQVVATNTTLGGTYHGSGTNQSQAETAASSAFGYATTAIEGAETAVGTAPAIDEGAPGDIWSLAFAGDTTLNLSPEAIAPGAMGYIKALIGFLATVFFAQWCARELYGAIRVYSAAQTGGVPDISIAGTNIGGPLVFVVAGVFVALWVVLIGAIVALMLSYFTSMGALTMPANPNSAAAWLLAQVFPLALLVSLAWARVTITLGLAKLIGLASSVSRFLAGK